MPPFLYFPKPLALQSLDSHMIHIEGGSFLRRDEYNRPIYQVKLDAFEICRYPVTQALWEEIMGKTPSAFPSPQRPVEQVSWEDCQDFLETLNEKSENPFRLPTEAEWEYAARGGRNRDWKFAGSPNVKEVAFYQKFDEKLINNSQDFSQPTGLKLPNEYGLYDLSGNVREWCQDWYDNLIDQTQYGQYTSQILSSEEIKGRVWRGGSWFHYPSLCTVSYRNKVPPTDNGNDIGFRLARNI